MKIHSLKLHNFGSFADCELDLNRDGLIAVTGDNGAGKSTLFRAVEWVLYGSKRGPSSFAVRRDNAPEREPCSVELIFEVGGHVYRVWREVRPGTPTKAELRDIESEQVIAAGATPVTTQVTAILGLNRDVFAGTFYARQREVQSLDKPSKHERRKQFELLLGIERLRKAAEFARADANAQDNLVEAQTATLPDVKSLRAELERLRQEAQQAAPAVKHAEEVLKQARECRQRLRKQVEELNRREREAGRLQTQLSEATELRAETKTRLEELREKVIEAKAAIAQLDEVAPVAGKLAELTAREREADLRRQGQKQANALRDRQKEAMAHAAALADRLSEASAPEDDWEDPEGQLKKVQSDLSDIAKQRRGLSERLPQARADQTKLETDLRNAERVREINEQLAALSGAQSAHARATERVHRLRAARHQLAETIEHDAAHRKAVATDGPAATCPRCRRSYGDAWQTILDDFDADLGKARASLKKLDDDEIPVAEEEADEQQKLSRQAQDLAGERKALGRTSDPAELRQRLESVKNEITRAESRTEAFHDDEARLNETANKLRAEINQRKDADERRKQLLRDKAEADRRVSDYAEQLEKLPANSYDPEAHAVLKSELKAALRAAERAAGFKATAEQLPLLERRLDPAEKEAAAANEEHDRLTELLKKTRPAPEARDELQQRLDAAQEAVEQSQEKLNEARNRAESEDQAVASMKQQLHAARSEERELRDARGELGLRQAVAKALNDFAEETARRAHPILEQETTLLLTRVTRGRYASVTLGDDYLLRVFDDGKAHPLARFSGGEQDLASLCLRLGLSRTLARQQGIEAGFVILDEVFGSQDDHRRENVLEQLRELDTEFRQIFVISHVGDIAQHAAHRIEVERVDATSVARQQ
jgi:DNA repair protein SbcC/Rad50